MPIPSPNVAAICGALLLGLVWPCASVASARADAAASAGWHKVPIEPYDLNNKQDAIAFANAKLGL